MHPISKEAEPLHTYHVDHLGPLETTSKQYKHIFAIIDAFTKFCWLHPTKSTTSKEAIAKLNAQSLVFGNPFQIVSDRGTAFTSDEFRAYCEAEEIKHVTITTGLPRANGQVERLDSIIVSVLSKLCVDDPSKWYRHIERVQRIINSTYCRSTNTTPLQLLTAVKMLTKDDILIKQLIDEEMVNGYNQKRQDLRENAKQSILKLQEENRRGYNLRRKPAVKYKVGSLVAVKRTQLGGGLKLKAKYLGPYQVLKCKYNDTYDVVKAGVFEGPRHTTTCAEYMKPWSNYTDETYSGDEAFGSNA